jgi:hypothetical protein
MSENKPEYGLRYNENKPQWSLVDFDSLESMVKVLEYGAHKYSIFEDDNGKQYKGSEITKEQACKLTQIYSGKDNWKNGMPVSKIMESLLRHAFALLRGEFADEESGQEHIGHLMCNAMFVSYMLKNKPELNDLIKK